MKTLVTGSAGMLGSALAPALVQAGHRVVATDIRVDTPITHGGGAIPVTHLDVRDRAQVRHVIAASRPDVILHLAAETDLETCEADPDHAWLTNTIGTRYVASAAREVGVPLVYVSTAGVFDGEKETPYTEFDRPHPINTYGASKLEGEHLAARTVDHHYIVRAGWMVGGGPDKDHKFVARIIDQVRAGTDTIHAVTDKLGTPTYAPDFSACLLGLLDSGLFGVYHMVCGGSGTRYDVAERILEVLGRDDIAIEPVDSSFFADEFPTPRPRSEILRNLALDLQGMNTMRPWRVALEEYLLAQFPDLVDQTLIA